MSKRKVYRVQYSRSVDGWAVRVGKEDEAGYSTKARAIAYARDHARQDAEDGGRSQVVVHKKDGKIQTEYTYPRASDPRRHKG